MHIDRLAREEATRKTEKMNYIETKGKGDPNVISRNTSGDIIKWTKLGPSFNEQLDRYAHPRQFSSQSRNMQSESQWSRDLAKPAPRIRKDFAGSGNIISWM